MALVAEMMRSGFAAIPRDSCTSILWEAIIKSAYGRNRRRPGGNLTGISFLCLSQGVPQAFENIDRRAIHRFGHSFRKTLALLGKKLYRGNLSGTISALRPL